MNLDTKSRKEIGALGERATGIYLERRGFRIEGKNIAKKTGEIDVLARKGKSLHFVEVKTLVCEEFPDPASRDDRYDPSANLHPMKIRKVARTAEWLVTERQWEGDWQVGAALVWIRRRDGMARVEYLPQIL